MNEWQCPFCTVKGNTKYNKTALGRLESHLVANHLDQAYKWLMTKYDKESFMKYIQIYCLRIAIWRWGNFNHCITYEDKKVEQ
jgi:hypothetical protein